MLPNFRPILGTRHYRSSRTDGLDLQHAKDLGAKYNIHSIVDMRSMRDLRSEHSILDPETQKTYKWGVDRYYPRYIIRKDKDGNVTHCAAEESEADKKDETSVYGRHYMLDIMTIVITKHLKNRPLWVKAILFIAYLLEKLFGSNIAMKTLLYVSGTIHMLDTYKEIVQYGGGIIYQALELLSEPSNVPSLVICAYGKDRTGIIAALVQACCGLDDHAIAKDFAKSEEELGELMAEMESNEKKYSLNSSFKEAKYEVMMELLGFIRKQYGGIPQYLESIGFTSEKQDDLRRNVQLPKQGNL